MVCGVNERAGLGHGGAESSICGTATNLVTGMIRHDVIMSGNNLAGNRYGRGQVGTRSSQLMMSTRPPPIERGVRITILLRRRHLERDGSICFMHHGMDHGSQMWMVDEGWLMDGWSTRRGGAAGRGEKRGKESTSPRAVERARREVLDHCQRQRAGSGQAMVYGG